MKCLTPRGAVFVTPLLLLVAACWTLVFEGATRGQEGSEPINVLACRLANYKQYQDSAWAHLPTIGFKYLFINVPPPEEVEALKKRLARHGLAVAVIRGDTDLSRETCVDELAEQCRTCKRLCVKYMFLSPKHPGIGKELACERLRLAGEVARKSGVTIALETHPDLGTNADVHLQTMKRINHPNIRVNFDSANITYYNKDRDAVSELKKIIEYVATVEVKDHNGRFETWNFPALGRGVVDIPGVLKVLEEHGYKGPITMEVEGIKGVEWDEAKTKKIIADSVAYLRLLGKFK